MLPADHNRGNLALHSGDFSVSGPCKGNGDEVINLRVLVPLWLKGWSDGFAPGRSCANPHRRSRGARPGRRCTETDDENEGGWRMAQVKIDIVPGASGASFQPTPQSVTPADDLFWVNHDEASAHQPTPDASDPTAWMPYPIQAKQPGLPAPQSRGLTFAGKKGKKRRAIRSPMSVLFIRKKRARSTSLSTKKALLGEPLMADKMDRQAVDTTQAAPANKEEKFRANRRQFLHQALAVTSGIALSELLPSSLVVKATAQTTCAPGPALIQVGEITRNGAKLQAVIKVVNGYRGCAHHDGPPPIDAAIL